MNTVTIDCEWLQAIAASLRESLAEIEAMPAAIVAMAQGRAFPQADVDNNDP